MKKILITFILLNLTISITHAQAPTMLWESFFNGNLTGKDVSNAVVTDSAANVFVTGSSFQTFAALSVITELETSLPVRFPLKKLSQSIVGACAYAWQKVIFRSINVISIFFIAVIYCLMSFVLNDCESVFTSQK